MESHSQLFHTLHITQNPSSFVALSNSSKSLVKVTNAPLHCLIPVTSRWLLLSGNIFNFDFQSFVWSWIFIIWHKLNYFRSHLFSNCSFFERQDLILVDEILFWSIKTLLGWCIMIRHFVWTSWVGSILLSQIVVCPLLCRLEHLVFFKHFVL